MTPERLAEIRRWLGAAGLTPMWALVAELLAALDAANADMDAHKECERRTLVLLDQSWAALDAANADAADQHAGRKWAQRLVGSLPDEMRVTFDSRMDELDAAHRARIEAQP